MYYVCNGQGIDIVTIRGITQAQFQEIVRNFLTPARAISSPQHLKGREKNLTQIERAFNSVGKHVFIYGDRGVGKTSLGQTAAFIRQSADAEPIVVACTGVDFFQIIKSATSRAASVKGFQKEKKVEKKAGSVQAFSTSRLRYIRQRGAPSTSRISTMPPRYFGT